MAPSKANKEKTTEEETRVKSVINCENMKNCALCNKFAGQETILCDYCGSWIHFGCTKLPTYELSKYISDVTTTQYFDKYSCEQCTSTSPSLKNLDLCDSTTVLKSDKGISCEIIKTEEKGISCEIAITEEKGVSCEIIKTEDKGISCEISADTLQILSNMERSVSSAIESSVNRMTGKWIPVIDSINTMIADYNTRKKEVHTREETATQTALKQELMSITDSTQTIEKRLTHIVADIKQHGEKVKGCNVNVEGMKKMIKSLEEKLCEMGRKLSETDVDKAREETKTTEELTNTDKKTLNTNTSVMHELGHTIVEDSESYRHGLNQEEILVIGTSLTKHLVSSKMYQSNRVSVMKNVFTVEAAMDKISEIENCHPRTIITQLGSNDLAKSLDIDQTVSLLISFLLKLRASLPETVVLVSGILPRNNRDFNIAMSITNKRIEGFCKKQPKMDFINHGSHFQMSNGMLKNYLFEDDVHLNNNKGTAMLVRHYKQAVFNANKLSGNAKDFQQSGKRHQNETNNRHHRRPVARNYNNRHYQGKNRVFENQDSFTSHDVSKPNSEWRKNNGDKVFNKHDLYSILHSVIDQYA